MAQPLKGKWIVITRPEHQANALSLKLKAAGAQTILFPLLEILPVDDFTLMQDQLNQIEKYELAIFTSSNAVDYSLKWLDMNKLKTLKIAAIGKKTASLLKNYGIHVDYFPKQDFNSEALLALPEIQQYRNNNKIAIMRGQDGRDFLKQGLEKQGADVNYIDVYKRTFPQQSLDQLSHYFKQKKLDIILITSGTSLINLFNFLPTNDWLNQTTILLGSKRIEKQLLNNYTFHGTLVTASDPSDETLYQQLLEWKQE